MANWFYFTMCHIEAEYKGEENYVEDYPEMDQEVEDMDPGWDDEGNDEVNDDADFNDEYDNEEYDDNEQPDKGITCFDNDWWRF